MLIKNSNWIRMKGASCTVVPVFRKMFNSIATICKDVLISYSLCFCVRDITVGCILYQREPRRYGNIGTV